MSEAPQQSSSSGTGSDSAAEGEPRRSFLVEFTTIVVWAIVSLAGVVIGLVAFLDPLRRKSQARGFIRVGNLTALPADGQPRRFPVVTDLVDAWTYSPNQPIGAVWLRRTSEDAEVQALHTTCPHAGCAVGFHESSGAFLCPCHNSAFDLAGERVDLPGKENPSPRPMDRLECKVDESGNILVDFQDFYTGIHEKKPKL